MFPLHGITPAISVGILFVHFPRPLPTPAARYYFRQPAPNVLMLTGGQPVIAIL